MEDKPQTIPIVYRRSNEYRIIPVTGAVGGGLTRGMVVCNLCTESSPIPERGEIVISPEGKSSHVPQKSDPLMNVEILVGLIMTPPVAISLGQFLINQGQEISEQIQESREEMQASDND